MFRLTSLALLLGLGFLVAAAPFTPSDPTRGPSLGADDALIQAALKDSSIRPNLLHLSDVIGPRLTGSVNLDRACRWAADRMRDYGLENVTLEPYTIPEGWERGDARARLVEPNNGIRLQLASYGWRPGTTGKIVADVFALPGIPLTEPQKFLSLLQKYKGQLKGKIVLVGPPGALTPLEDINKSISPYSRPEKKGAVMPRLNYAAIQAVTKERDEFLTREGVAAIFLDSRKPLGLVNTTGGWRGTEKPSATNKVPVLSLASSSYALLHRLATRTGDAPTRVELEVSNTFLPGPIKVFNVVGELRGSEKPDEVVLVGAHIDSWDLGQGTTDNGTGTSIVLEVARMLTRTGIRPKRTIRFCLFSGEEQGLYGSRFHAEKHKDQMSKISAALVHDTGTGKITGLGVGDKPAIATLLEKELQSLKPLGVVDFKTRSFPGSDHQSFDAKGVPSFMMVQDPAYYSLSHHTMADNPERILEADLVQGATVMAVTAVRIANLDRMLPREKPAPKTKSTGE